MELLLAAIAPAAFFLLVIYKLDRFEPEPIKLVRKLYLLGVFSTIPIIIMEIMVTQFNIFALFDTDLTNLYTALVVAGFSEELFKWAIVYWFAYSNLEYDEKIDGIVYCVFVSLGFATVENILYVMQNSMDVAILRALTAVPAHMLFGVTMGYYLSLSKFTTSKTKFKEYKYKALFIPVLIHGAYDYILMSKYTWLLIFFIPFLIWLWLFNIKKLRAYYLDSKSNYLHKYGE